MAVAKNKAAKKEQEEAESDKALETEEATEEEKVESAEAAEEVTEVTEEAVVEQAEEPVEETEEIIAAKERIEELSSMKQDEPIEEESDEVEEASKEDSVEENDSEEIGDEAETVEAEDEVEPAKEEPAPVAEPEEKELSFEEMYKKLFGRDVAAGQKEYEEKQKARDAEYASIQPVGENESLFDNEEPSKAVQKYKYIGIAFKTYIMFTKDDDLYFMDQHAAHEKILFERIKANYNKDEEKDSQLMLLPDVITLTDRQMGSYEDNKELFEKAGFMCNEFGDNVVKLSGVPSFCMEQDTKQLFIDTLDEINTVARTNKDEVEYKFLATVACKAAVKAGMTLSQSQVEDLMRQLLECENPYNCPHGRPTIIKISRADLEKKFSRRL
jgi:DNA mismatch repair protein MutL